MWMKGDAQMGQKEREKEEENKKNKAEARSRIWLLQEPEEEASLPPGKEDEDEEFLAAWGVAFSLSLFLSWFDWLPQCLSVCLYVSVCLLDFSCGTFKHQYINNLYQWWRGIKGLWDGAHTWYAEDLSFLLVKGFQLTSILYVCEGVLVCVPCMHAYMWFQWDPQMNESNEAKDHAWDEMKLSHTFARACLISDGPACNRPNYRASYFSLDGTGRVRRVWI